MELKITQVLFVWVLTLQGILRTLIFYRDPVFTSSFLKELLNLEGITVSRLNSDSQLLA
jgi:hypothetical protein